MKRTRIFWTDQAKADLLAIRATIARDSRFQARRVLQRIRVEVERLQEFPESVALVPQWETARLREILVWKYRVIDRYEPSSERLDILMIQHGRRLLGPEPDQN